jgi:hypothetical protein
MSSKHTLDQLVGKTWEELEVVEANGYLHFPEKLLRRRKDGTFEEIPITIRVPREHEMRKARSAAREWAKLEQVDPDKDADLFDNMDSMCVLQMAVRNATPPYEPMVMTPQELERTYDKPCLMLLWAKLDSYTAALDPRSADITKEEVGLVIAAIAKERSIRPLHAYDGRSQNAYIVCTAALLQNLLTSSSSSRPFDFSTLEL